MNNSPMRHQLAKQLEDNDATEYYLARLAEFPEGQWIAPTNSLERDARGDSWSIFDHLHQMNLVECLRVPVWKNGSLCGVRTQFRYQWDLKYSQEAR